MGQNLTFLIGPEESTPFFSADDDTLSQPEVYGFMKAVFGADVVYDAPPKMRKQQMQNMMTGLRAARLRALRGALLGRIGNGLLGVPLGGPLVI